MYQSTQGYQGHTKLVPAYLETCSNHVATSFSLITSSPTPHPGAWGPSDRVQDYAIAASHSTLYPRTSLGGDQHSDGHLLIRSSRTRAPPGPSPPSARQPAWHGAVSTCTVRGPDVGPEPRSNMSPMSTPGSFCPPGARALFACRCLTVCTLCVEPSQTCLAAATPQLPNRRSRC